MHRDSRGDADLRSLDRERMYTIFAPLDPEESLPRELVDDQRRFKPVGRRELAGLLWLPALLLSLTILAWAGVHSVVALVAVALLFGAFWLFARSGGRRAH